MYTDGACKGNPGNGGWSVFWMDENNIEQFQYGGSSDTTNNRMELFAIIKAMEIAQEKKNVTIITDSQYAYRGITEWMPNWKKRGWKNSQKTNVLNRDLWEQIDSLKRQEIKFQWIKAHNGDYGNERADALANQGCCISSL